MNIRDLTIAAMVFLLGVASAFPEHGNIINMNIYPIMTSVPLSSTGVITSSIFRALEKTQNQTILIQASGASPNYMVELLVTLDRAVFTSPLTVLFVKPEIGGSLYTFTDSNPHVFPLYSPACLGQQLRITGLTGTQGNVSASELSQ